MPGVVNTADTEPMRRVALLGATGSDRAPRWRSSGTTRSSSLLRQPGPAGGRRPRAVHAGRRRSDGAARTRRAGRGAQRRRRLRRPAGHAVGAERGVDLRARQQGELSWPEEATLCLAVRERGGGRLLPVDSEHSAALQCLEGRELATVDSLVLTASGGALRGRRRDELADVTPAQARLPRPGTWAPRSRSIRPRLRTRGSS